MNIIFILLRVSQLLRSFFYGRLSGLGFNKTWIIEGFPIVRRGTIINRRKKNRKKELIIGHHFSCYSNNKAELGSPTPCVFNLLSKKSSIVIGNYVGISSTVFNCRKLIKVGDNVKIGAGCLITDNDSHPIDPVIRKKAKGAEGIKVFPVIIERDVFIGARTIILKGVTIGEGAVIGAGSVVSHDIPSYSIACGNPAKVLRKLN